MPNDFLDALKGFTPAAGIDRDALLFEAGRASVPSPARAWRFVALLALTQALTLGLCVPRPEGIAPAPQTRSPVVVPTYPERPSMLRELPYGEAPTPAADLQPAEPPLRPGDHKLFTSFE